jgi:PBP1b-binding outer membrane lipoprotein LpoB
MKKYFLILSFAVLFAGCSDNSDNTSNDDDSVSTAPITDPSYNPKVEADSAAKQMNLDSAQLKDSGRGTMKE